MSIPVTLGKMIEIGWRKFIGPWYQKYGKPGYIFVEFFNE